MPHQRRHFNWFYHRKFGTLTVIEPADPYIPPNQNTKRVRWLLECTCGNRIKVTQDRLMGKRPPETCPKCKYKKVKRHGKSYSPEYRAWQYIKGSTFSHTHDQFPFVGGKGLNMEPTWEFSFNAFLSDVGPRPSPQHHIGRINHRIGYTKYNTVWTKKRGKKNWAKEYTYQGQTATLSAWAKKVGIKEPTLRDRIRRGWSFEQALLAPLGTKKQKW